VTGRLVGANKRYINGDEKALEEIVACIAQLADFYPHHIEKEDRRFFAPVMKLFTPVERDAMLEEGFRFDQELIHRKYKEVVAAAEREFD
jgi:hemerythrin-like domain-containing protein